MKASRKKLPKGCTIDPNMPDFSKDPVIVKKVKAMEEEFKKHPFPKELLQQAKRTKGK